LEAVYGADSWWRVGFDGADCHYTFILKMATAMLANKSDNFQHSLWLNPES
jgi:hypothetical protein